MKASFIEKPIRSGRYYPLVEKDDRRIIVGQCDTDKRRAVAYAADVLRAARNGDSQALKLLGL